MCAVRAGLMQKPGSAPATLLEECRADCNTCGGQPAPSGGVKDDLLQEFDWIPLIQRLGLLLYPLGSLEERQAGVVRSFVPLLRITLCGYLGYQVLKSPDSRVDS